MKNLRVNSRFAWNALLLSSLLLAVCYALSFVTDFAALIDENGPLENLQLVTLVAAMAVFVAFTPKARRGERIVGAGMVLLCCAFFLRELDMRDLYGRNTWQAMLHDWSVRLAILAVALTAAGAFLYRNSQYIPEVIRYSFSRDSWPLIAASVLLIASKLIFESIHKHLWRDPHWEFFEQGLQSVAYLLILLIAVRFLRNTYTPEDQAPAATSQPADLDRA